MKANLTYIMAIVLAAGLVCAAMAQDSRRTADVQVAINVLPYASVTLSQQGPMTVTIDSNQTNWSTSIGGVVRCNTSVSVSAAITPPSNAPAGWSWTATPKVSTITTPGTHVYTEDGNMLLTVSGSGPAAEGGSFELIFAGMGLSQGSTPQTPAAGYVIVTVIPQ